MANHERFQSQTLNPEDYKKIETAAKLVRGGLTAISALGLFFGISKNVNLKNFKIK